MDLREQKVEQVGKFIKWEECSEMAPIIFEFVEDMGESEYEFGGKTIPKHEFLVNQVAPHRRPEGVLSLSRNALNSLIDAQEANQLESVAGVWWKAWRSGSGFKTTYHWELTNPDGLPF